MLNYTGHPLYDVGVATITAFVGKSKPEELTGTDLDKMAEYLAELYTSPVFVSHLSITFTINSGFTTPSFKKTPEKRALYSQRMLKSYSAETPTSQETCVFTGKPAVALSLDTKDGLPLGRAFRQHIPLLAGEGKINFHPYGDAGVPVSGEALLAIQAFPLGCAKRSGKLLAVHSDNSDIMQYFAEEFTKENQQLVQMALVGGYKKPEEGHGSNRTLLIQTLLEAKSMQMEAKRDDKLFSITAYYLSNSGQGPSLEIYHLPLQVVGFLKAMRSQKYRDEWFSIVNQAWQKPLDKLKPKEKANFKPYRNWLYEDLFNLPEQAADFIGKYFLGLAVRYIRSLFQNGKMEPDGINVQPASWPIVSSFLWRIMNMDAERIDKIRELADRLAQYVVGDESKGKRFFNNFRNTDYAPFRNNLIRVLNQQAKKGNLLFSMDDYIEIFEIAENTAYQSWKLARDLIYIRMVEKLYEMKWAGFSSSDVLVEEIEEIEQLNP